MHCFIFFTCGRETEAQLTWGEFTFTRAHTHTLSLSLTHTRAHTHSLSLTHTHTLSHTHKQWMASLQSPWLLCMCTNDKISITMTTTCTSSCTCHNLYIHVYTLPVIPPVTGQICNGICETQHFELFWVWAHASLPPSILVILIAAIQSSVAHLHVW